MLIQWEDQILTNLTVANGNTFITCINKKLQPAINYYTKQLKNEIKKMSIKKPIVQKLICDILGNKGTSNINFCKDDVYMHLSKIIPESINLKLLQMLESRAIEINKQYWINYQKQ